MRSWSGWALSALGVIVAGGGLALMVVLGPDNRLTTGPHTIETDDIAVVTAPKVIRWADVRVDILAEVPVRKPVFIGIGNTVDVQDFVGKAQRLEITSFSRPWDLDSREVAGLPNLPGAPTAVDWWIDSSAGLGGAAISTRLPDQTVSLAILSVGSSNLSGLEVTLAYGVEGGFAKGVALLLLGVALLWIGILVVRGRRARGEVDDDLQEEVVYVYVDEDGVEHEISAEEAAELDVVDEIEEVEVVDERERPALEPDPEPVLPTVPQPLVPGVMTAADIAAADAAAPDPGTVVYVYVDEDGVEHEISEDELADFEVVDEEDER